MAVEGEALLEGDTVVVGMVDARSRITEAFWFVTFSGLQVVFSFTIVVIWFVFQCSHRWVIVYSCFGG
jgi:hypothetical protein